MRQHGWQSPHLPAYICCPPFRCVRASRPASLPATPASWSVPHVVATVVILRCQATVCQGDDCAVTCEARVGSTRQPSSREGAAKHVINKGTAPCYDITSFGSMLEQQLQVQCRLDLSCSTRVHSSCVHYKLCRHVVLNIQPLHQVLSI
jgi:hypothetical protein